ncbi:MAG: cupin [Candidatus Marinimicrobia bacterium CG08_land_8_20_14_0_20_45_22]|nr:MAG: cupin [Candidatus Marinimicrobia bacterium CG08_land_8_20_14_0_20_45_22]
MSKPFFIQKSPTIIPTTDGKYIEEHFGRASDGDTRISIALMVAPPHWSEPPQTPEFDEFTLLQKGKKQIEIDGGIVILNAGESIVVKKGTCVRYSNPFDEPSEYISVCLPAFSLETVHRKTDA